jgi:hypothetical protein
MLPHIGILATFSAVLYCFRQAEAADLSHQMATAESNTDAKRC